MEQTITTKKTNAGCVALSTFGAMSQVDLVLFGAH